MKHTLKALKNLEKPYHTLSYKHDTFGGFADSCLGDLAVESGFADGSRGVVGKIPMASNIKL